MKKIVSIVFLTMFVTGSLFSQTRKQAQVQKQAQQQTDGFTVEKNNAATPVKDQARTGTCWSFSTTSLLEIGRAHV